MIATEPTSIPPSGAIPFSIEVFPARTSAAALALGHTVQRLAERGPAFVAVTSGADGTSAAESADLVEYVSAGVAVPVLAHVTTWGATEAELRERLRILRDQGVRRVLAVRGDPPRVDPGLAGELTASDLVALAAATLEGADAEVAVAAFPLGHPSGSGSRGDAIDRDLELLAEKQRAGATSALTQVQFEPRAYTAYVERARAAGITIPIVPGVMPVTNVDRLRRVVQLTGCPLPVDLEASLVAATTPEASLAAGVAHAVEVARGLLDAGAPALHFYTLNLADPVLRVLDELAATSIPSLSRDDVASTERTLA